MAFFLPALGLAVLTIATQAQGDDRRFGGRRDRVPPRGEIVVVPALPFTGLDPYAGRLQSSVTITGRGTTLSGTVQSLTAGVAGDVAFDLDGQRIGLCRSGVAATAGGEAPSDPRIGLLTAALVEGLTVSVSAVDQQVSTVTSLPSVDGRCALTVTLGG